MLKSWTLTFRPEGGKDSKEIGLKARMEYNQSDSGLLGFGLMLPSNSYEMKGNFKWNDERKTVEASFTRAGSQQLLLARAGLIRTMRSEQQIYKPRLILTYKMENLVDLLGN